jgi:flavin reductase (DIM6/NTAB) family NADH-FMN oxidoreductase RutF
MKKEIGARTFLYPMPVVLVGSLVNGKPNYLTIAYCGIVQHIPPMIAITLGKSHYTNLGIRESRAFSVNIPSEEMLEVTDYCGLSSGNTLDKSTLFTSFYGKFGKAPMIGECPLCLECRLVEMIDFGGSNELFIGEIIETYVEPEVLTDGLPDVRKIRPIVFSMHDNNYWRLGEHLGKAWSVGRKFRPKNP